MQYLRSARLALPAIVVFLAACGDFPARSPLSPAGAPGLSSGASPALLQCPLEAAATVTGTVDALGGVLRVTNAYGGAYQVAFPRNAVSDATVFRLSVPATSSVKVRVGAVDPVTGLLRSVTFPAGAQPVVSISYQRCGRPELAGQPLHLYNIDEQTGAILAGPFGGQAGDSTDPRVIGAVPHFSEYAIGSPEP